MKQELLTKTSQKFVPFNRYAHVLIILLSIYFVVKGDYELAFTNLGVALVFDPFDPSVKWQQRPMYQRMWLILNVAILFTGLIYIFFLKF